MHKSLLLVLLLTAMAADHLAGQTATAPKPGDMGFWLVGMPQPGAGGEQFPPVMLQARARVLRATKDAKIFFLNSCNDRNAEEMIKEGVMICTGGYEAGRKFTKRQMPW